MINLAWTCGAGNYERADELAALGVEVEDSDDGPTYRLPEQSELTLHRLHGTRSQ
ncbi:hypothetical protein [Halorhabdus amylolytica]|uniref:hypothetical protein n=1 Tax=Halorhabdus amylolytica TaxID=2559573 RepID=UPI00145AEA22|nr:hypothetical protein [Halorhabdus amylolytica]